MSEDKKFNELFFVPPDNDTLREKYEILKGGTCGPATIAVLEHITVQEVLSKWRGISESAFRGFSPINEMKETLTAFGYTYKYVRGGKAKTFPTPQTDQAIIRIQFLKEDGTEYYWAAAGAHTHYVLIEKIKISGALEGLWIFCNGEGWFTKEGCFAEQYLKSRGYVSSYLELTKEATAK